MYRSLTLDERELERDFEFELELILAGSIQCIVCSEYLPKAGLTELFFPNDILRADLPLLLLPVD